jgi:predicted ribosome quality control (RQC) complex YloA/Tae2 family protein
MAVKAKQAKEKAESDAQKLVNKQIDILHSMETYEPHTITAHQLPLGMVAVKKKDFLEVYKHASASVGLRNTWKRIQETEQGQQVEKLQKELEEERAKNAENARLEQQKQKRYSEVLEKAENTLKMQKNTIEQLKKENEELREKFELVKKVVLDMWDHVSDFVKTRLEVIGIRKSRGYHR